MPLPPAPLACALLLPLALATAAMAQATGATIIAEAAPSAEPVTLPSSPGSFVKVQIAAAAPRHPSWAVPVEASFRRSANGWTLVGFERLGQRSNGGPRRGAV